MSESEEAVPPRFDAPLTVLVVTPRKLLGLAWAYEMAARTCEADGQPELGRDLRASSASFRAWAVI